MAGSAAGCFGIVYETELPLIRRRVVMKVVNLRRFIDKTSGWGEQMSELPGGHPDRPTITTDTVDGTDPAHHGPATVD